MNNENLSDISALEGSALKGRFKIIEQLGSGGSSVVYRAKDLNDGDEIALKILSLKDTPDDSFIERFKLEFNTCKNLSHPNIIKTFDYIENSESIGFTMEYIPGKTLDTFIETNPKKSVDETINIFSQLLLALEYLHSLKITHRDLKPENLILMPDGTLKVIDLGIIKRTDRAGFTNPSLMLGTPQYLSPEYITQGRHDHRSDIYAVGVILFEFITGNRYLADLDGHEALEHLIRNQFRWPKDKIPKEHTAFIPIINKALEINPEKRFQIASEMLSSFYSVQSPKPLKGSLLKLISNFINKK